MGAYAPVPGIGPGEAEALVSQIQRPVLAELERRGTPFVGLLYAGLMLTESGPKVLEFNGRFGDPETQAVVPLLDGDLLETLAAAAAGDLGGMRVEQAEGAAVTVVLAAERYPAAGDRGATITGVEDARAAGALVFHAGTARHGERLVTNGGRILGVTAVGTTVAEARDAAYDAVRLIDFDGMRYRSDIAAAAAAGASYAIGAERRS
jgi:phosphoribosylamine--glycine ligase